MRRYSSMFFLIMFVIGTDTFLIAPLLPTLAKNYGISTSISGWLVSAYAIGYALCALFSGPISDGRNRKKVLTWGLAGFTISTFLCGFAFNFPLMITFRLLAGISASFVTPQVWASIPVVVNKKDIVKVMGYATAGLSVSQLVGIPIGSYLAVISWQTPFFVISVASLILLILSVFVLPELEIGERKRFSFFETYENVLKNKKSTNYLFAYFIFQMGSFTAIFFISTWFTKSFGLTLTNVGTAMIAIGAGNLIGSLTGSKIVKKLGIQKSFLFEILILIFLYVILAFIHTFVISEIIFTIIFLFNGFIFPIFMATLQSTTVNERSTISSLSNAAMYFGETIAGVIGGILFKEFLGFTGIAIFAALTMLISLGLYWKSGLFKKTKV